MCGGKGGGGGGTAACLEGATIPRISSPLCQKDGGGTKSVGGCARGLRWTPDVGPLRDVIYCRTHLYVTLRQRP